MPSAYMAMRPPSDQSLAQKDHRCAFCRGTIYRGDPYAYVRRQNNRYDKVHPGCKGHAGAVAKGSLGRKVPKRPGADGYEHS